MGKIEPTGKYFIILSQLHGPRLLVVLPLTIWSTLTSATIIYNQKLRLSDCVFRHIKCDSAAVSSAVSLSQQQLAAEQHMMAAATTPAMHAVPTYDRQLQHTQHSVILYSVGVYRQDASQVSTFSAS